MLAHRQNGTIPTTRQPTSAPLCHTYTGCCCCASAFQRGECSHRHAKHMKLFHADSIQKNNQVGVSSLHASPSIELSHALPARCLVEPLRQRNSDRRGQPCVRVRMTSPCATLAHASACAGVADHGARLSRALQQACSAWLTAWTAAARDCGCAASLQSVVGALEASPAPTTSVTSDLRVAWTRHRTAASVCGSVTSRVTDTLLCVVSHRLGGPNWGVPHRIARCGQMVSARSIWRLP